MIPLICYENLLENGTVNASSENADFPVENCFDWITSDYFKPAGSGTINITLTLSGTQSSDYFAFYGHDLPSHGGTIKLQYWDGSAYQDCFAAVTPTDTSPQVITFAAQTSTQWRVVITCTSVFSIAVISFGAKLTVPRGRYIGFTYPRFGRNTQVVDSTSDGGEFLGRSIVSKGVTTTVEFNHAPDAWMRSNWQSFIEHAEQKPFFYVPDSDGNPTEAVYCFTDGTIPSPSQSAYGFMSVTIPVRGMVE